MESIPVIDFFPHAVVSLLVCVEDSSTVSTPQKTDSGGFERDLMKCI
ncbi:MAG: hypothetical protein LBJ92_04890 [Holosporales bacterium]|nr:hypothetical protein [Holosporales bacterium]